jgi:hypothetical protein
MGPRRLQAADDPTTLIVHNLDRRNALRCATSSRATAADYSGKLAAQVRVYALRKARSDDAAAFARSEPQSIVRRDGNAHSQANELPVPVRPCRPNLPRHKVSVPRIGRRRNGSRNGHRGKPDMSRCIDRYGRSA